MPETTQKTAPAKKAAPKAAPKVVELPAAEVDPEYEEWKRSRAAAEKPKAELAKTDDVDTDPETPPPWPHQHVQLGGEWYEARRPTSEALMALSMASTSKHSNVQLQMTIMQSMLSLHLSGESFIALLVRMMDPDDEGVTFARVMRGMTRLAQSEEDRVEEVLEDTPELEAAKPETE